MELTRFGDRRTGHPGQLVEHPEVVLERDRREGLRLLLRLQPLLDLDRLVQVKEGLEPKQETQTLATITFQNYFRMFDKLAGMTGTAITEAG
ncbi:MAG: hypothetical protein AAGA20_22335, partial [Planctomycetota bacterium]